MCTTVYCLCMSPCFSSSTWRCLHCTKVNSVQDVLCEECERPRIESISSKADESQPATITGLCCRLLHPAASVTQLLYSTNNSTD